MFPSLFAIKPPICSTPNSELPNVIFKFNVKIDVQFVAFSSDISPIKPPIFSDIINVISLFTKNIDVQFSISASSPSPTKPPINSPFSNFISLLNLKLN